MKYLTRSELEAINRVVVRLSGGSIGLREPELLESICIKPQTEFGGVDVYPDLFLKAAVLFEAIVNYHVFIDGNMRTGFAAMARFLSINSYELTITNEEIVSMTVSIATDKPTLAEIAAWIKAHSARSS